MDRIRLAAFAIVLVGIVSVVVSVVLTALTPWHLDPLQVLVGLVVVGVVLWLRSLDGGGSETATMSRGGTPNAEESKRLLLEQKRRIRSELIQMWERGEIDEDQLDRGLKHALDAPVQGPPQRP